MSVARHSWRESVKDLKDCQHACLSLAGQHKAHRHSVPALWHMSFNHQRQCDLCVKDIAS